MRLRVGPGSPPWRHEATRIARPSDGSKARCDSARKYVGGVRTKILYFNPEFAHGRYADIIRQSGHDVAAASNCTEAFAMMRRQICDALVVNCAHDSLDIQNSTTKAQGLQPSLAVFLAGEWGDELATSLEELGHVLTMLEDDECAMLSAGS